MRARLLISLAGLPILAVILFAILAAAEIPGSAALTIVLTTVLAAVVAWRLTLPLQRAVDFSEALSRGQALLRLPETASGEAGRLFRALNRLAEAQRRELEERGAERTQTDLLLQEMGEGVLAIDSAGNVARANAELRRVIGASEAIGGRALSTIFRNPELVRFLSPNAVPEEGRTEEFEVFGRDMLVTARRLPAGGVVAVFSDFTELRRLDQVRTEFVANASHELRTPLTAIRGFAETLLDANLASENRRTFSQRIVDHADRMAAIVEDLLTLARLEEPGHEIRRDRIAIAPLVQRIIESFAVRVRAAGMEIRTEIQPPELEVVTDPDGLRQVLENLVDNALRHTNARVVGIRAGTKPLGQVTLTVWDDGSGIPSSQLDRIFERFYRVDPSRSRATGGTGLGLSIVRHWIESMGGRVWAESTLGIGTEIHVELPVQS